MKDIHTNQTDHDKNAEVVYSDIEEFTRLTKGGVLERFPTDKRFESVLDRKDTCSYDIATFKELYINRFRNHWKGVNILKDSFQMTLLQNILFKVKP